MELDWYFILVCCSVIISTDVIQLTAQTWKITLLKWWKTAEIKSLKKSLTTFQVYLVQRKTQKHLVQNQKHILKFSPVRCFKITESLRKKKNPKMFQQQKNIGLLFCYRWTELFSSRHFSLISVRKASVFYCCSWYVDILALLLEIVFAGWSRSDATSRIYLQLCVKCNVYTISKKKKSQANFFAYC